jgi:cytochrome c-type biogenesis protein
VFVALGASATEFSLLLHEWSHALSIVAGIGIVLMGAHFLGVFKWSAMYREARIEIARPPGLWSAYLMGLAFAIGWTPCIGPILAAILAVAGAQETVARGALLLAAYAFGLGVPFVAAAIAMERFLGLARGLRGQFARLEKAVGVLLVLTGAAFLTGGFQSASAWLVETFPTFGQ